MEEREKFTFEANQKQIEKFLLFMYTVYTVFFINTLKNIGGSMDLIIVDIVCLALCFIIYAGKYKSYNFRATITCLIMQVSIVCSNLRVRDFAKVVQVMMIFIVLFGLYAIPQILNTLYISMAILFAYHAIWGSQRELMLAGNYAKLFMQLGNFIILLIIMKIWTSRDKEGGERLITIVDEFTEIQNKKDDFIANVSHEIRTPLNTICGMSDLILETKLPKEAEEKIKDIQLAGNHLKSIVSDILDFSELQSGKSEIEEENYNISSTINDIVNTIEARRKDKPIEILVNCDTNIPTVLKGDEKKIRRVVVNLVDNAIKFTNEGGIVLDVRFRRETYGINLIISIKDTGIGMSQENVDRMFSTFNQADSGSSRHSEGIGLGLAISQALIQKMGGAITVKSKYGKGTNITVVIPQKVVDDRPMVSMRDMSDKKVAICMDLEQIKMSEIRDEFDRLLSTLQDQTKVQCFNCRTYADLIRKTETEELTHIFMGLSVYKQDEAYFDNLAKKIKVVVVYERSMERYIKSENVIRLVKPFYILNIAPIMNGKKENKDIVPKKLTTKDVKVLVVDDNWMNLQVVEGMLSGYGIQVVTAESGQQALDKMEMADFDFVFMDHMMPEMDGVETLHRIRNKVGTYYQKVPIIALSANAVAGARTMLIGEGFNDFVEKPIEKSVLERVLIRTIAKEKIIYSSSENDADESVLIKVNDDSINLGKKHEEDLSDDKLNNQDASNKDGLVEEKTAQKENASVDENINVEFEHKMSAIGMDAKMGILYCNGKEAYIQVLRKYYEKRNVQSEQLKQHFANKDWKNYVICVHGIKGSLKSIGAETLSDSAKMLEMAGKNGDYNYIVENHDKFLNDYKAFLDLLPTVDELGIEASNEETETVAEIALDNLMDMKISELENSIMKFEEALYNWDQNQLYAVIAGFDKYKCCGVPMINLYNVVSQKIAESDFMSALDKMKQFRTEVEGR